VVIQLANVAKSFRTLRQRVAAVRGISFAIGAGEIVGFVGPNGAGKSTTIKMLMGFLHADRGHIEMFGSPPGQPQALRRLGYMPEQPTFPDTLTGQEWLRYAYRLHVGQEPPRPKVQAALAETGLGAAGRRLIRGYSKGMLQRLGLAQALITDPDLLILDEPLSGLDPLGRTLFKSILQERAEQGKTLFFSSHILDDVEHLCSRILLLDRGLVAMDRPVAELFYQTSPTYRVRFSPIVELVGYEPCEEGGGGRVTGIRQEQLQPLLEEISRQRGTVTEVLAERPTLEELFVAVVGQGGRE